MPQVTHDQDLQALAKALNDHPELRKAALSGMAGAIKQSLDSTGIKASPAAVAGLGSLTQLGGNGGNPVAQDYVVRGVSSVLAAVKVRPTDLLQHGIEAARELERGR